MNINKLNNLVANSISVQKDLVGDFLHSIDPGKYAARDLFEMYQRSEYAPDLTSARLFDFCMNNLQREFHPRIAFKIRKRAMPVEWIIR